MSDLGRTKALFDQAIDLQGRERAAFLDRECAANPGLRERVESLLIAAEHEDSFLSDPTMPPVATMTAPKVEAVGTRIGPYKLLQLIGEGGFGSVFMAEQVKPVHRRIALKVIKLGMDTRQVTARFEAERQALAMMDHPHIARVLDGGATETGRPYFVMELVPGDPITRYCDKHNLPITDRLSLFLQVCEAVQHAHQKGIIHRDIKPTNVLVSTQDGRPFAKVIDFGIAKATAARLTEKTLFTEHKAMIGTPEYMSPEQAEGGHDIDTRTDVYSLGVLMYELLTGSTPFRGKDLREAAYFEIQRIIREVEPERPSTRLNHSQDTLAAVAAHRNIEPRRLGMLLRGDLDWIVMKALEKDRSRRYETASALALDLRRHISGEPVLAAPPSAIYRLSKFTRRHRIGVGIAALIAIALAGTTIGTTFGLLQANAAWRAEGKARKEAEDNGTLATQQAARADREAKVAKREAGISDSVNRLMIQMIKKADRGRERGNPDVKVREVMDAAAGELLGGGSDYDPEVQGGLAATIGATYQQLTLVEEAEKMLRFAAEKQKEIYGEMSLQHGEALSNLGMLIKFRGRYDEAAQLYARARKAIEAAGEAGEGVLYNHMVNEGALALTLGKDAEAERAFKAAMAWCEAHGKTDSETYIHARNNLANVAHTRGDSKTAETLLKQNVAAQQVAEGSESREQLLNLHNLGVVQANKGDLEEAEATIRQELKIARRLYGEEHESIADALKSLESILRRRKDLPGSEAAAVEGIRMVRKLKGDRDPDLIQHLTNYGSTLDELGRLEEAEGAYREAAEISAAAMGEAHTSTIFARYRFAGMLERRSQWGEAEPMLRKTLAAAEKTLPEGNREEWMRHMVASCLGGVLIGRASDTALPREERMGLLSEAEKLETGALERLLVIQDAIGRQNLVKGMDAAKRRVAKLYALLEELEPGKGHAAAGEVWGRRLGK